MSDLPLPSNTLAPQPSAARRRIASAAAAAPSFLGQSNAPLLVACFSAALFCGSGFLVPDIDFSPVDAVVLFGLCGIGAGIVWLVSGPRRQRMLFIYWLYVGIAAVAFVLAALWASPYGNTAPVFMIDRHSPRDDYHLWEVYIRPAIGSWSVSLVDGETNAPLYWYVNVRVQEFIVLMTGRPMLMLGNALNIVVGSITAALLVGATDLALRPSVRHRFRAGLPVAFVITCPWLLASSIIAIREIWVYAIFSAAVYGALTIARLPLVLRGFALAAIGVGSGVACFFLRQEMVPMIVVLVVLVGMTVRDKPLVGMVEMALAGIIVSSVIITVLPFLALREDSVTAHMVGRSEGYVALSSEREAGAFGTVGRLIGNSFVTRAVFQSFWLPFTPLPKVMIPRGSTYALGKLLTPAWVLACIAAAAALARPKTVASHAEGTVARRFRWPIVWMLIMTGLVGATSAEVRHFYAILPVFCLVLGDIFQTRAADVHAIAVAWRRGVRTGALVLALSAVITISVFGVDALFPAR